MSASVSALTSSSAFSSASLPASAVVSTGSATLPGGQTITVHITPTAQPKAKVKPTCCSRLGTGLKNLGKDFLNSIIDVVSALGINILLGLAARFTYPSITPPAFVYLGVAFATTFVMKLLDRHNIKCLNGIKECAMRFQQKHPYILKIVFIASLALCLLAPITPVIMFVSAGLLGIFHGLIVGVGTRQAALQSDVRSDSPIAAT